MFKIYFKHDHNDAFKKKKKWLLRVTIYCVNKLRFKKIQNTFIH